VSALIHAATMVTAGVYLIARASPLFTLAPFTMDVIAWIGAITALFAATIGLVKPNIKRVLAYSTVSQLGYMFLAVGIGGFAAGIFHLMTHAFFKALLFLSAGAVIHALGGEEDMRHMGGLRRTLPVAYWTFLIATLAISGVPGFSGFFSKDEIISLAFTSARGDLALGLIALVTAGLTAVYMFRAFFLTFHGESRVEPHVAQHLHHPGLVMAAPLVVLGVLSVVGGYVQFPTEGFGNFLTPTFAYFGVAAADEHGLNAVVSLASIVVAAVGIVIAWYIWYANPKVATSLGKSFAAIGTVLMNDYGIDALYNTVFVGAARGIGQVCASIVDGLILDGIVNGVADSVRGISVAIAHLESGYVRTYAVAILTGAIVIIAFMARGGL
jgi:NADH-quinone oxidoreductase subunit L